MRYVPIFDDAAISFELHRLSRCRRALRIAADNGTITRASAGRLADHLKNFSQQLRRIRIAASSEMAGKTRCEVERTLSSYAAKVSAALLGSKALSSVFDVDEIEDRAARINLFAPCNDPVPVSVETKASGGQRFIHHAGWRHQSRQWIARTVLAASGVGSEYDLNSRGIGSVRALEAMSGDIEAGFRFWLIADIKNFFPTVKQGHLHELMPIDAKALSSVIFVGKDVPIQLFSDDCLIDDHSIFEKEARLGLAQGSKLSPLLASAFLGRELRAIVPEANPALHIVDDIAIGARVKSEAEGFGDALLQRLASLKAGPLQLKHCRVYDAHEGIIALGRKIRLRSWNYEAWAHLTLSNRSYSKMHQRARERFGEDFLNLANDELANDLDAYIDRSLRGYGIVPTQAAIADLKTRMVLKLTRKPVWGSNHAS